MDNPNNTSSSVRGPRFAVVSLQSNADVGGLFTLLISNGYSNVTFLNSIIEHSDVKQYVKEQINKAETGPNTSAAFPFSLVSTPTLSGRSAPDSKSGHPPALSSYTLGDKAKAEISLMNEGSGGTPPPKSLNTTSIPTVCPSSLTVQKAKAEKNENEDLFVYCKLCDNKLMATRLSNLTNHVRRHAANKQWSCAHCQYQHNEQAKVRVHMSHQHQDVESQPIDNLTPEMQQCWNALMEECFPGQQDSVKFRVNPIDRRKRISTFEGGVSTSSGGGVAYNDDGVCDPMTSSLLMLTDSATSSLKKMRNTFPSSLTQPISSLDELMASAMHSCVECGTTVASDSYYDHIRQNHLDECVPYQCDNCGYVHAEQHNVGDHISELHSNENDVTMSRIDAADHMHLFVHKFFPSAESGAAPDPSRGVSEETESGRDVVSAGGSTANESGIDDSLMEKIRKAGEAELDEADENMDQSNDYEMQMDYNFDADAVLPEDRISCTLCGKILVFLPDALNGLIMHAKRHYCMKQFECPECPFGSVDVFLVRTHIQSKHHSKAKPIDHNNEVLQSAWVQVMKKCFPGLTEKIKELKASATATKEESPEPPSSPVSSTRVSAEKETSPSKRQNRPRNVYFK